ncbi:MAG: transporter substrate-binding domain-containing protein, partial [Burkholderiaceae bacterium]
MKTFTRLFGLGALALAAVTWMAPASAQSESMIDAVKARDKLQVGFSSFVPWAMRDKKGEWVGFEVDVANKLAKDLGVKLDLIPTAWDGIIPSLIAKKFDVIIGGMSV